MAKVLVTLRIMPTGVEVNPNELEEKIKEKIKPERIVKQPIAFGLVSLFIEKIIEDKEGEMEELENKIRSIEGVSSVEILRITRLL